VTTPIFYVNAAPHVGHLYTMIIADVLKRWRALAGDTDAQLLTGTDEHGMKIQQAAAAAGMDTQAFCDMNFKTFEALAKAANMDYNHFIRTTDAAHKEAVQYFWVRVQPWCAYNFGMLIEIGNAGSSWLYLYLKA
jgi:methionyl-tRNA synthetase